MAFVNKITATQKVTVDKSANDCGIIHRFLCYRYPTPQPDPVLQNVSWKPISKSNFPSLSIDTDLKMKHGLNNGHAEWWMKLYSKYIPDASPCWPFYSMFDVNQ